VLAPWVLENGEGPPLELPPPKLHVGKELDLSGLTALCAFIQRSSTLCRVWLGRVIDEELDMSGLDITAESIVRSVVEEVAGRCRIYVCAGVGSGVDVFGEAMLQDDETGVREGDYVDVVETQITEQVRRGTHTCVTFSDKCAPVSSAQMLQLLTEGIQLPEIPGETTTKTYLVTCVDRHCDGGLRLDGRTPDGTIATDVLNPGFLNGFPLPRYKFVVRGDYLLLGF
jgi:hypothetical protein